MLQKKEFSKEITELSENFVKIYNQSLVAEANDLDEIAGIGYRKALEFLIKDYLIKNKPDCADDIKKLFLGKCIDKYVENSKVKEMAKRAAWLGNDETHYTRKWEDKDITDLKALIEITVYWINYELLTEQYISIMQE